MTESFIKHDEGLFLLANISAIITLPIIRRNTHFMKIQKIGFYLATAVLTAIMIYSVQMYLRSPEAIAGYFESVSYPGYLVYPLAIAKILGLVAIWGNFSKPLKEWAYAGFFFDVTLAFTAHMVAKDGGELFSILAFIALMISYFLGKLVRP